jgi:hypothetical protein
MHDKKAKTKHQSRTRVTTVDRPGVAGTPLNAPRETAEAGATHTPAPHVRFRSARRIEAVMAQAG